MLLFVSVYALYLCAGWIALVQGFKYTPHALRREVALNGVGHSVHDQVFNFFLTVAYLFVLHVWPVALYRKIRHGHVVGK